MSIYACRHVGIYVCMRIHMYIYVCAQVPYDDFPKSTKVQKIGCRNARLPKPQICPRPKQGTVLSFSMEADKAVGIL